MKDPPKENLVAFAFPKDRYHGFKLNTLEQYLALRVTPYISKLTQRRGLKKDYEWIIFLKEKAVEFINAEGFWINPRSKSQPEQAPERMHMI